MSLRVNATLTFDVYPEWGSAYRVADDGIELCFLCADPGPGMPSFWIIHITDTELAGAINQTQLKTLVTDKLKRKFRAANIGTKLDPFVGQSITI